MVPASIRPVWHLPTLHLSATPQSGYHFAPPFIGSGSASVILPPLFIASMRAGKSAGRDLDQEGHDCATAGRDAGHSSGCAA
jgi:hypothetical protein